MRGRQGLLRGAALVATIVVIGAAAGCSSGNKSSSGGGGGAESTTTTTLIAAPKGLPAFYAVPQPLPSEKPGALVKYENVDAPDMHGTVYRVMYVSTGVHDEPHPVTGLVAVPKGAAPAGGWQVVTWGHGTNGMTDTCAPSLDPNADAQLANLLLDKGYVITASDYQGEGTPGLHPYIAGETAARNVVDIVRAAHTLPGLTLSDDYVMWGHSQGGQTAMFTLKSGPGYAKELNLKGVVAGAPPSQFNLIYNFLQNSPYRYYLLMAAGGLNAAYGDEEAPLDAVLTPEGMKLIPLLDQVCAGGLAKRAGTVNISAATKGDPFENDKWRVVLDANDPQQFTAASPVPLLMIQGGNDEQIPPISTKILADHLCDVGQNLIRWIYPGQSHAGVIGPSANDMLRWIKDRFAGGANPDPYVPTGQSDIEITKCPK
jgi:pimeloyl-ACP methyl ester carboxylesterase